MDAQRFLRGQVWWLKPDTSKGNNVQLKTRPYVIVSNNDANRYSPVLLVAPCTTQEKHNLPTHVEFLNNNVKNTVLLEQAGPYSSSCLVGYICTLDDEIMSQIDEALSIAYGLSSDTKVKISSIWTKSSKQELVHLVDEGKIPEASEKFHLKPNTVKCYYYKFLQELAKGGEDYEQNCEFIAFEQEQEAIERTELSEDTAG